MGFPYSRKQKLANVNLATSGHLSFKVTVSQDLSLDVVLHESDSLIIACRLPVLNWIHKTGYVTPVLRYATSMNTW